jgi:class 3 adenylate cyclase
MTSMPPTRRSQCVGLIPEGRQSKISTRLPEHTMNRTRRICRTERPAPVRVGRAPERVGVPVVREGAFPHRPTCRQPHAEDGRRLATIVFFDIVGSTRHARDLGDRAWSEVLRQLYGAARESTRAGGGRVVKTLGDGFLAVFDTPTAAIHSSVVVGEFVARLGLAARAGIHTAEIAVLGDDIAGIGVHVAARVARAAHDGETWVSPSVRDSIAGSGHVFANRGRHHLAGLDEECELFAVVPSRPAS